MKVLIVEDTESKANYISDEVRSNIPKDLLESVVVAPTLSEAVSALEREEFGLIVLDLMVPFIPDGVADRGSGLELLRQVRRESSNSRSAIVVGLSAYPDEVEAARAEFDRLAVVILQFDHEGNWKAPFSVICRDAIDHARRSYKLDFLIFVALDEEFEPFEKSSLIFDSKAIVQGLNVQFARLGNDTSRGAIVKIRRMGLVAATLDSSIAISAFKPKIVAMAGICAGFSNQAKLGQLVLSSPAWEYQAGKWSEKGFLIEPYQISIRAGTKVIAEQTFSNSNFLKNIEDSASFSGDRPARRTNPMIAPGVTGSAVVADASRIEHISAQHRKLAVLDMETYGVYAACNESSWFVTHFFSIKCVVDLADSNKSDELHSYGSAVSSLACVELISSLLKNS